MTRPIPIKAKIVRAKRKVKQVYLGWTQPSKERQQVIEERIVQKASSAAIKEIMEGAARFNGPKDFGMAVFQGVFQKRFSEWNRLATNRAMSAIGLGLSKPEQEKRERIRTILKTVGGIFLETLAGNMGQTHAGIVLGKQSKELVKELGGARTILLLRRHSQIMRSKLEFTMGIAMQVAPE